MNQCRFPSLLLAVLLANPCTLPAAPDADRTPAPTIAGMVKMETNRVSGLKDASNSYTSRPESERRQILAMHCLAIEKDGIALDPYAYEHDGAPFFWSYVKNRVCY
ncbi:MAG TPA: hypothetical protein VG733_18740, partial [Chthoniobacteraceae bacterium]|nr:hypothetical protein [Chthoniobacteraceae bacterium]